MAADTASLAGRCPVWQTAAAMTAPAVIIEGTCDERFRGVRDAFERNFAEHNEVGAAVAVTANNEPVVDLWGGWADKEHGRPWERDTITPVWSLGKALTSVCVLRLVDAGRISLDEPVAAYWPQFAQAGKERLPVRYLLAHQAGLPAVRKPLPAGSQLHDWAGMVAALAEQKPWWEPGTRFGYHTNTHGFLAGEVLRRVDGRKPGHYIREQIAGPFGVDFLIGFGPEDDGRTARFIHYQAAADEESQRPWLERDPATVDGLDLARILAYRNPPSAPNSDPGSRAFRAAEYPSTNAHSNARAVARLFGILASGGTYKGQRLLSPEIIEEARQIQADGEDAILGRPNRFGLGFQLTIPGVRPLGPGAHAFGHYGNGGVLGFADPDAQVGFGYVCNRAGRSWRDPRNIALVDAVYNVM